MTGPLFAQLCDAESSLEADLLSCRLFDGPFSASLTELGYGDARSQAKALTALFVDLPLTAGPDAPGETTLV